MSTAGLGDWQIVSSPLGSATNTPSPVPSSIPANSHTENLRLLQVITETEPRLPGQTNMVDSQASQLEQTRHLYPDLTIPSDASLQGCGAVCNGTRAGGHWSVQEKGLHINCLELIAGSFAIKIFAKHRRNIYG